MTAQLASWSFDVFSRGHVRAQLGESPCWDADRNELWWVDVTGRRLLRTDVTSGDTQSWATPEFPGFVVLMQSNAPAVGMETGIYAFAPDTETFERLLRLEQPGCRFNDATVDASGRLWASTMALEGQAGRASIHLVTKDTVLETVVDGLAIPNGLAVDLERGRLLYSDSHPDAQYVWSKPLANGRPSAGEAQLFASTARLRGRPDGAALTADGSYWIAGVDGAELYVFGLDGTLDAAIPVPFPAPTKPCFLGHDSQMLVVASKDIGECGGYLARAALPHGIPAGITQPYWVPGAP